MRKMTGMDRAMDQGLQRGRLARRHRTRLIGFAAGALFAFGVLGDTTSMTVGDAAATVVDGSPVVINFPVTRTGDTSYDAWVAYDTVDGSAIGGTDFSAAAGSVKVPAGATTAMVPVTVAGSTAGGPDKQFQLKLTGASGAGPSPVLGPQQAFPLGAVPNSITRADLNGDGKPDLILPNYNDGSISIMLNTTPAGAGSASYGAAQTIVTGGGASYVAAVDLNGDGKLDLVVTDFTASKITVLISNTAPGAASFSVATEQDVVTGPNPEIVVTTDLNGDGKPDLILSEPLNNTVAVMLNTTAPGSNTSSFAAPQTFAAGNSPYSVATADFNGDGKPDLVTVDGQDNTFTVFLNTTAPGASTAHFSPAAVFGAGSVPVWVVCADIDGDGRPDLVAANEGDNTVSVLLNTTAPGAGTPTFSAQRKFPAGTGPAAVVAADLNGDGKPELIVADITAGNVTVLLNTTAPGSGVASFFLQQTVTTAANPGGVVAADINGDGLIDVVTADESSKTLSVMLNVTPKPVTPFSLGSPHVFGAGGTADSAATVDLNGDGRPDLIVTHLNDNTVSVLFNTAVAGMGLPNFSTAQTFATGGKLRKVIATDLNGDGKPDLVMVNNDNVSSSLSVLLNNTATGASTPSFAARQDLVVSGTDLALISATATDLNGDGKPDLLIVNEGGTVVVLLNITAPGASTASFAAQQSFAIGGQPVSAATPDLNGDGKPDLVVVDNAGNKVSVLLNTTVPGASTPGFTAAQTFAVGATPISMIAIDIDGDGRPDLAVTNFADSTVSVLLNTTPPGAGTPSFATQQTLAVAGKPSMLTATDIDGDGKPDLIVANGNHQSLSVLLNETAPGANAPAFAAHQEVTLGQLAADVAATDLDGDGRPDLLMAESGNALVLSNTQYAASASGAGTGTIHYAGAPAPAAVSLSPDTLDFGTQVIGNAATAQPVILKNSGGAALNIASIVASGDFSQSNTCGSSLAAGASCTISVGFQPSAAGARSGSVVVNSNAASSPDTVSLSGTGATVAPVAVLTPTTLEFGQQAVGSTSAVDNLTLANSGNADLVLGPITVSGDYTQSNACPASLAPGAQCVIAVRFAPTTAGARTGSVSVSSNAAAVMASLEGEGTAAGIAITPTTLAFGNQKVGTSAAVKSVQVSNTGNISLGLGTFSIAGSAAADYSIAANTCAASLDAGASCTVTLGFKPGATGSRNATLSVPSDATALPSTVVLSGSGTSNVPPPPPPTVGVNATGGGSFSGWMLALLGLAVLWRRPQLRGALRRLLPLGALCLVLPAQAFDTNNLYFGTRLGGVSSNLDSGDLTQRLHAAGYNGVQAGGDGDSFGTTAYLGYSVLPHVGIELGYGRTADADVHLSGSASNLDGLLHETAHLVRGVGDAYSVSLRYHGDILPRLSFNPRAGAYLWDSETKVSSGAVQYKESHAGGGITLGAGLAYRVWGGLEVGAGVDYFRSSNTVHYSLIAASLEWRFGTW